MADDTVKVTETTKEYELQKSDIVPDHPDEEPAWYNKTAGMLDKFRMIPRLVMLAFVGRSIHLLIGLWTYLIPQTHKQCLYLPP